MSVQPKMTETEEDKAFREAVARGRAEVEAGLGIPAEKAIAYLANWRSRIKK